jgi:hypothetical protein
VDIEMAAMIPGRWVCTAEGLVPANEFYSRDKPKRSGMPAPMIISDHLHEIVGQHDGKVYTSASALRRSYRAHGLEEVGTEPMHGVDASERRPKVTKDDVGRAVAKVRQGYKPEIGSASDEL